MDNKVAAILGVTLTNRTHFDSLEELDRIPGVSAVYVATGKYDLFVEVMMDSIENLDQLLFSKEGFGGIEYIAGTETFNVLNAKTKFFKLPTE
ncbi:Lrp/AsnC ligand binding domain-containing protein [Desulforhopalus singaporensis]|uniref:AsnC family protein n=1 Tax=Desulforhopalus singaporensis TaxID=91360 RepID=A0A1H0V6Q8_9BACT|nr:Lrp/AsnC ligand binding domain-containing protein [Desulforhopalus singaporensis]SDP73868.1 AsnC family protein [Desulforhopalus singaporensis]